MARTVNYRLQTGPGAWVRASGELPFDITGLSNGEIYEVDIGDGVLLERTPTGVAPPSYPITFPTALERDIADAGVDTYTVAAGFTADAGDRIVITAYAFRASGTGLQIETAIIHGQSMTRAGFIGSSSGAVAIFSAVLAEALEATDDIVMNFTSGSLCNVWHLQPVRCAGGGALGSATTNSAASAILSSSIDVPENGTVVGVFASVDTANGDVVTGLESLAVRNFVNTTRRMVMVGQREMTAQTGRSVTFTNPTETSRSRRSILIAITPE